MLFVSAGLIGTKIRIKRVILSALIGAAFSCLALFWRDIASFPGKVFVVSFMSLTAYGFGSFRLYLKQTIILFIGFFVFGGAAGLLPFDYYGRGYEIMTVIILAIWTALAISLVFNKIKAGRGKMSAEVKIYKDGKSFLLTALLDTGNLCTDVKSGLPVIISENIFGEIALKENVFATASGYGKMGIFYPDFIEVALGKERFSGKDAAVGIIDGKISPDGSFNALIGGICFDRLNKKTTLPSGKAERRRGILHRDGRTAPTALGTKRGGSTFKEA